MQNIINLIENCYHFRVQNDNNFHPGEMPLVDFIQKCLDDESSKGDNTLAQSLSELLKRAETNENGSYVVKYFINTIKNMTQEVDVSRVNYLDSNQKTDEFLSQLFVIPVISNKRPFYGRLSETELNLMTNFFRDNGFIFKNDSIEWMPYIATASSLLSKTWSQVRKDMLISLIDKNLLDKTIEDNPFEHKHLKDDAFYVSFLVGSVQTDIKNTHSTLFSINNPEYADLREKWHKVSSSIIAKLMNYENCSFDFSPPAIYYDGIVDGSVKHFENWIDGVFTAIEKEIDISSKGISVDLEYIKSTMEFEEFNLNLFSILTEDKIASTQIKIPSMLIADTKTILNEVYLAIKNQVGEINTNFKIEIFDNNFNNDLKDQAKNKEKIVLN